MGVVYLIILGESGVMKNLHVPLVGLLKNKNTYPCVTGSEKVTGYVFLFCAKVFVVTPRGIEPRLPGCPAEPGPASPEKPVPFRNMSQNKKHIFCVTGSEKVTDVFFVVTPRGIEPRLPG